MGWNETKENWTIESYFKMIFQTNVYYKIAYKDSL